MQVAHLPTIVSAQPLVSAEYFTTRFVYICSAPARILLPAGLRCLITIVSITDHLQLHQPQCSLYLHYNTHLVQRSLFLASRSLRSVIEPGGAEL